MKKPFTLFSILLLAGSLAACSESTVAPAPASEPKEEAPAAEAKATDNLKVGESAQFDNLKVTLNSVKKYIGTGEFDAKPQNDYFLVLDVTVENTGDQAESVSSLMNFHVYDANSYEQSLTILGDEVKGSLDGEIGPGRKLAGELPYDVVDGESFEFVFDDLFTSGQAIWKINKADIAQ